MKAITPILRRMPFLFPATALPAALVISVVSLFVETSPQSLSSEVQANVVADAPPPPPERPERLYFPITQSVTASLPGGTERVKITLGVAVSKKDGISLLATLSDKMEMVQAGLAQAVMKAAETLPSDATADELRGLLPEVLRSDLNDRLVGLGLPPAVIEVLITEWAVAR